MKTDVISKVQVSFEPMWKQAMVKSIYSAIHYICKFYHLKTDVILKVQVSFEPMWKQALSLGLGRANFLNLHKNFPK